MYKTCVVSPLVVVTLSHVTIIYGIYYGYQKSNSGAL